METSKRKNQRYSYADKLQVIELYEKGYGSTKISRELQICITVVKIWIRMYQHYGISVFTKQPNKKLSVELKKQIVQDVLNKLLSYQTVALKYHIGQSTAYNLVQLVKKEGFSALKGKKRGRPKTVMGRPKKKQPETELEKLEEELRYLRAENAYLKKVKTLVQERLLRESGKQSKPSKN